jgi:hypothetical protein
MSIYLTYNNYNNYCKIYKYSLKISEWLEFSIYETYYINSDNIKDYLIYHINNNVYYIDNRKIHGSINVDRYVCLMYILIRYDNYGKMYLYKK